MNQENNLNTPQIGITQLLVRWGGGDHAALDDLMPLVYDELRKLAQNYLRHERQNHSLQPTALIHEAYLRMIDQQSSSWQSRAQFYGLAAKIMRHILVDHARTKKANKRDGSKLRLTLTQAERIDRKPDVDVLALNDALIDLAKLNPQHSNIVELRFFGGLTIEETASVLGLSDTTVERSWRLARAWLRNEMQR